tara:strand:+ start:362 stop:679 length:318 start_codon:yes stop_codon:yes gene_type:complete
MTKILKTEIREDLKYVYFESGFLVIKPQDHSPTIPAFCPVCEFTMNNNEDDRSFIDFGCCSNCENKWVQPNRKKWISGWRPSKKNIKKYQKERNSMPISFILENT